MYDDGNIVEAILEGSIRPTYLRILGTIADEAMLLEKPMKRTEFRKRVMQVATGGGVSTINTTIRHAFEFGLITEGYGKTVKPLTDQQYEKWEEVLDAGVVNLAGALQEAMACNLVTQKAHDKVNDMFSA